MDKKYPHFKDKKETVPTIILVVSFLCYLLGVGSIFITRLGILTFDFNVLPQFWMKTIPVSLVALIFIREVINDNTKLKQRIGPKGKKLIDTVFFVSLALLIFLPFALGIIRLHLVPGIFVPVGFFAMSVALTFYLIYGPN